MSTAYNYTKHCQFNKKINQKTIVIVGGGLVASAKFYMTQIDYCVAGDGEIIIKNLVNAIRKTTDDELSKILGITTLIQIINLGLQGTNILYQPHY